MKVFAKIVGLLLVLLLGYGVYFYLSYGDVVRQNRQDTQPYPFYTTKSSEDHLIAHAGGAIDGHIYTDSLEAYENSIRAGMKFVEIDFLETTDGPYVAAHDWETFNEAAGLSGDQKRSLEEIRSLKLYGKYTPMDEEKVVDLMSRHPNIVMISDKTRDVEHLAKAFPFHDRMIVQVFHLSDYLKALKVGIKYPTLRLKGGRRGIPYIYKKLMAFFNVKSVILGELSFNKNKDFIKELHDKGVTVILYGNPSYKIVDHPEAVKAYAGTYVDLFDSDYMQHL